MNYKVRTLALLLLAVAAGNSARAQQATYAQGCKSYTFTGTPASGSGSITYRWYRNGQPIANSNSVSYTLPASEAYGENVEFKRGVMSSGCPGDVAFSAPIYLTFSGVKTSVCWAHFNIESDYPGNFVSSPDAYGMLYRGDLDNNTDIYMSAYNCYVTNLWIGINNQCPDGWRLPTIAEFTALNNTGTTWAAALTRGNTVAGRFYGANHATCTLPSNMVSCIFLPAVGMRVCDEGGAVVGVGNSGAYWSSSVDSNEYGQYWEFAPSFSNVASSHRSNMMTVRCVR